MANKAMWDWMDKQEGRKDSSHANMNKERERQGYKKEGAAAKKKELAKKIGGGKTFMERIADKAAKSDKERTGQGGRDVEAMFDKHFGKKK